MGILFVVCVLSAIRSCLSLADLWSPAGKGLISWPFYVMFSCVFVTFIYSLLGQVWYLIVSIPDLYLLPYFSMKRYLVAV